MVKNKCRMCGVKKPPHELFIYVDGNNISITKNSPILCYYCYIKKYGNKYKSNILKYKKDYNGFHPTQKPILLLEDLIKTFSNEGNLVVDLTMGSGSTGIACMNTNRNFFGIELDEDYYNISKKRVEEKRKEKDLQAGTLFGDEM